MTDETPKPLLEIDGNPIVHHIMENFSRHGFDDFVLCLGYKSEAFEQYFGGLAGEYTDGGSVELSSASTFRGVGSNDWDVTLVDTGLETSKSERLLQVRDHIDADRFLLTYGDGLADVNVEQLVEHHEENGTVGTVTGVKAPSSFGVLETDGDSVSAVQEKPLTSKRINVGFFVFETTVFDSLSADRELEQDTLNELADRGELGIYRHDGFFKGVDTRKGLDKVRKISTEKDDLPWLGGEP
nr:sugar phosphate nucleotidyltransferase [Halorussus sp. DT72]